MGYVIGFLALHAHLYECAALSRSLGRDSMYDVCAYIYVNILYIKIKKMNLRWKTNLTKFIPNI